MYYLGMCLFVYAMNAVVNHELTRKTSIVAADNRKWLKSFKNHCFINTYNRYELIHVNFVTLNHIKLLPIIN